MGFLDRLTGKKAGTPAGLFPSAPADGSASTPDVISLISISKPVWAYGLDTTPGLLPPKQGRGRRIAFAQLATPGLPDLVDRLARPEDDLGRWARGLPLWLAETLYFAPHYTPIAALASLNKAHHALLDRDWSPAHIAQLVDTAPDGLDFVVTGTLVGEVGSAQTLTLHLWDVARGRERKAWSVEWTPATADTTLSSFLEHFRLFMEWSAYSETSGLSYTPPARPSAWIPTLGASLSLFLAEKTVLDRAHAVLPSALVDAAADHAATGEAASLAWLTLQSRALRLGLLPAAAPVQLHPSARVAALHAQLNPS